MNLYEFTKDYLEKQTAKYLPVFDLKDLDKYINIPLMYNYPKMLKIKEGSVTKNDIMKVFAWYLSSNPKCPITLEYSFDDIALLLNDFDPEYINIMTAPNLYNLLKRFRNHNIFSYTESEWCWNYFCENIITAAKYTLKYYTDYESYLKHIRQNPEKAIKELKEIRGFGDYTVKKFLVHIGCFEYLMVDGYTNIAFRVFDETLDNSSIQNALEEQAKKANVTPYTLNNIIKLIITGNYYIHKKLIYSSNCRNKRKKFLTSLKTAIDNGTVIL